jgi:hypothetical protein
MATSRRPSKARVDQAYQIILDLEHTRVNANGYTHCLEKDPARDVADALHRSLSMGKKLVLELKKDKRVHHLREGAKHYWLVKEPEYPQGQLEQLTSGALAGLQSGNGEEPGELQLPDWFQGLSDLPDNVLQVLRENVEFREQNARLVTNVETLSNERDDAIAERDSLRRARDEVLRVFGESNA